MSMGFGLAEVLMAIHAEKALREVERRHLLRPEEIDLRGRLVRPGGRLPRRLGRLLVALGRRLQQYASPQVLFRSGSKRPKVLMGNEWMKPGIRRELS